jgi:hypothetical protein
VLPLVWQELSDAQHPEHEVESHTQPPDTQCSPEGHAAVDPHSHAPPEQVLPVWVQSMQAAPEPPQVELPLAWQVPSEAQHPEHEVESQTQLPDTQCWPDAHAAVAPHAHAPLEQDLPVCVQSTHEAPGPPHVVSPLGWQVPSEAQQPEQEVESQTQLPDAQCWPEAHAALAPQWHAPLEQVLPVWVQSTQEEPVPPQVALALVWQVPSEAQHPEHEVESQTQLPDTQCWPDAHAAVVPHAQAPTEQVLPVWVQSTQAPPRPPQVEFALLWQVPSEAQHPEQEVESQTQPPDAQCSPEGHAVVEPHPQAPPEQVRPLWVQSTHEAPDPPQVVLPLVRQVPSEAQHPEHDVLSQTQLPETQCSPEGHGPEEPHEQAPETQVIPVSVQSVHALPGVPHVLSASVVHCPEAEQQPAQDDALHTHAPPTHAWPDGHFAFVPHMHCPVVEQVSVFDTSHVVQAPPFAPQLPGK